MGDISKVSDGALIGRRALMAGMGAGALLALPGCASLGGFGLTDAVKRILTLSSQNAFARLTSDGGFYDNALTRLDIPSSLGSSGNILSDILVSSLLKSKLQRAFNGIAEDGARRAAPLVADAIRNVSIADAAALVRGGPTAASDFLRGAMGGALVEAMVPALGDAMRVADEPLVGQALAKLTGVDVTGVARGFSADVDNAIWKQIGVEESAIRANPSATNDPLIMGVFGIL